jgi:hypothetical protein
MVRSFAARMPAANLREVTFLLVHASAPRSQRKRI